MSVLTHETITDFQLIKAVSSALKDPDAVRSKACDEQNINTAPLLAAKSSWRELTLAHGYPSMLLLFSQLEKHGFYDDKENITHRYVLKIKESIEKNGIWDLSLFGGLTGICFAMQQASCNGSRYQKMLHHLHEILLRKVDGFYFDRLNENFNHNKPSSPQLYDPIQGITGVGRYLIDHLSEPGFEQLLLKTLKALVKLCQPVTLNERSVVGWYVSADDPINALRRSSCLNGNFNLGLAHGVISILTFLSIALLRGLEVEGQKQAIEQIAVWVHSKSFLLDNQIVWGHAISFEDEIQKKISTTDKAKDGWCYGVPGVARSLFFAGKALQDDALKNFAIHAFKGIFKRNPKDWNLPGPMLCHGISGLLLMTHLMSQEKNCEDLVSKTFELKELLYSYYSPENIWGFQDFEPTQGRGHCKISKAGLLEGSAGILLTLLTLSTRTTNWYSPFLINE